MGSVLAMLALVFIAFRFRNYDAQVDFSTIAPNQWSELLALAACYGASSSLLAAGWWLCLRKLELNVSWRWAFGVYGVTQLSKYVPGNVFQLAGRQALGMLAGLPGWRLAKSAVLETGLLSVAGALVGCLVLGRFGGTWGAWAGVPCYVAAGAFTFRLAYRYLGTAAAQAFAVYSLFLLLSGLLFWAVLTLLGLGNFRGVADVVLVVGAYVLAWLIGMLTPGAPAGVGVREVVLFFFLKGLMTEADVVLAVVAGRAVTVGGDVMAFALASLWRFRDKTIRSVD